MLTGAGVYNEGAGRRAGKCWQACRNNDLRLGKQQHGTDASTKRKHYTLPLNAITNGGDASRVGIQVKGSQTGV